MERVVICMKWGRLYGPDYVNVLHHAVRENLSGAFRFVCLTDDSSGIVDGVECLPIPDIGLLEAHWYNGAWPKIALFGDDLHGLRGRALFIDLDMVICGDLTPFFTHGEGFLAIDEGAWTKSAPATMSSIMAFDLGSLGHLVAGLRANRDLIVARHGLEQNYLHEAVGRVGYWPREWLASFKRHLRRPLLIDRLLPPLEPPAQARVVVFHGRPRPIDLIVDGSHNRDIWPHHITGPVPWMRDYWTRHGGRIGQ
jgi:hypothetical protein